MTDKPRVYRSRALVIAGWLPSTVPVGMWGLWLVHNDGSSGPMVCPRAVSWLPLVAAGR